MSVPLSPARTFRLFTYRLRVKPFLSFLGVLRRRLSVFQGLNFGSKILLNPDERKTAAWYLSSPSGVSLLLSHLFWRKPMNDQSQKVTVCLIVTASFALSSLGIVLGMAPAQQAHRKHQQHSY
jgi:hypothetical protein